MDYDHARKAGNAADVWKHFCLLAVVARMLERRKGFRYLETHAGAGQFRLDGQGEWRCGVARLALRSRMLPDCHYVRNTAGRVRAGASYSGSWRWVLSLARARRRALDLCLFDIDPRVIQAIPRNLPGATLEVVHSDGFRGALRSPPADLVFVDPPYAPDAQRDWEQVMSLVERLEETRVCFLVWYPLFLQDAPDYAARLDGYARFEIDWAKLGGPMGNLRGCGLLAGEEAAGTLGAIGARLDALAGVLGGRCSIRYPST